MVNVKENFMILKGGPVSSSQLLSCTHCTSQFEHRQGLQTHLDTAHSKEALYQCNHCPRSYKTKKSLSQHKSRDHKGHIWRCATCGQNFTWKDSLKSHAKVHTDLHKAKKSAVDMSRGGQLRNMCKIVENFNESITGMPERDKKKLFKDIIKRNPDILETYGQYPLDDDDVTEMVQDVNLSDPQVLKISPLSDRSGANTRSPLMLRASLRNGSS